jgi:hypothetical protein
VILLGFDGTSGPDGRLHYNGSPHEQARAAQCDDSRGDQIYSRLKRMADRARPG